jgi:hypothetical protein
MNREDIIRMALEAGLGTGRGVIQITKFAALIEAAVRNNVHTCHKDCQNPACVIVREAVAAEREACAIVCDDLPVPPYVSDKDAHIWDLTCVDCAAAIRARAQG